VETLDGTLLMCSNQQMMKPITHSKTKIITAVVLAIPILIYSFYKIYMESWCLLYGLLK